MGYIPNAAEDISPECVQFLFNWKVCIAGTICVLGTVGNTLSIIMLHAFSQLAGCLIPLVKALAWADFLHVILYSVVLVIPDLAYHCCGGHRVWDFTMYSYAYIWPFATMTMACDTWLIVLISVHRYIAVCYPLRSSDFSSYSRLRKQVIIVTAVAFVMEFPRFFEYEIYDELVEGTNETRKNYQYSDMHENYYYQLIYKSIIMLSYKKYVPMVVITFAAVQIIRTIRKMQNSSLRTSITSSEKTNTGKKVTRTMLTVMIVFIVTQLSNCVYPFARTFLDVDQKHRCNTFNYYVTVSDTLALINPCANFFIYLIMWKSFRTTLTECCCVLCAQNPREDKEGLLPAMAVTEHLNESTITTEL